MKSYNSQDHIETLGTFWIKSLKNVFIKNGIVFSGTLQSNAKVLKGLRISGQDINAEVKGTDSSLCKIKIAVKKTDENIKEKIKNFILLHPSLALDISLGCFSELFMELIEREAEAVFPQKPDDVLISCSCGNKLLCPHLASVYRVLEKEINKNPFLVLNLRGITTSELIESAGFNNDYIDKLNKNIHDKFVSLEDYIFKSKENSAQKKSFDLSFPKIEISSLFFLLPNDPLFFERKDFKSKLINIYETVETELDGILVTEKLPPARDTEFYLYYSDNNVLKAFVTPVNSFMYYLKSKGSRVKFSTKRLTVPVFDEDEQKFLMRMNKNFYYRKKKALV